MHFDLTDDQRAIQQTAREFLSARYRPEEVRRLALEEEHGFTDEQWQAIVGLGWTGLVVPEAYGGLQLGAVELAAVQEELGYALAPTPFLSTVAATLLIGAARDEALREEYMGPLAAGELRGTVALWDADGGWSPTCASPESTPQGAAPDTVSATKIAVPDAGAADFLVVAGEGGHHVVMDSGAEGVTIRPTLGIDPTRKLFEVELQEARGRPLEADPGAIDRAYQQIATATAAESVGVAQRAMEMAVAYAKERQQFGRPVGAYQAVSHPCAQMLLETEGARSMVRYAAWALEHEPETGPVAAAMAKAYASDAGWRVTAAALQVHGGIGFTWEHDLHFFLKRARANAAAWGDSRSHRGRVADLVGV